MWVAQEGQKDIFTLCMGMAEEPMEVQEETILYDVSYSDLKKVVGMFLLHPQQMFSYTHQFPKETILSFIKIIFRFLFFF